MCFFKSIADVYIAYIAAKNGDQNIKTMALTMALNRNALYKAIQEHRYGAIRGYFNREKGFFCISPYLFWLIAKINE